MSLEKVTPAATSLLGGAAPILGGVASGLLGMFGQSSANKANAKMAREQMAFQERMSNTAYQRSTKDLEKAGLNRILALGSPASSPAGQTAQMKSTTEAASNSAANMANQIAQLKAVNAQTAKTKAETVNIVQQGQIKEPLADLMDLVSDGTKAGSQWIKDNVSIENMKKIADQGTATAKQIMTDIMDGAKLDPPKQITEKTYRSGKKTNYKRNK